MEKLGINDKFQIMMLVAVCLCNLSQARSGPNILVSIGLCIRCQQSRLTPTLHTGDDDHQIRSALSSIVKYLSSNTVGWYFNIRPGISVKITSQLYFWINYNGDGLTFSLLSQVQVGPHALPWDNVYPRADTEIIFVYLITESQAPELTGVKRGLGRF